VFRCRFLIVCSLLLLSALPAAAADRDLLIPIVARGPGLGGSAWRTDVVLTNINRRSEVPAVSVTLTYLQTGTVERSLDVAIPSAGSLILEDVLLRSFGTDAGAGMLLISPLEADARLGVRARIYNVGSPAGEYGQIVTAVPLAQLTDVQVLPALSGAPGRRTNTGVANPGDMPVLAWVTLYDLHGEERGSFTMVIPPRSLRTWNDITGPFGFTSLTEVTVRITASSPVSAFASIVREDTGDADYVTAAATTLATR
jgi:hypothetical protein